MVVVSSSLPEVCAASLACDALLPGKGVGGRNFLSRKCASCKVRHIIFLLNHYHCPTISIGTRAYQLGYCM